MAIEDLAFALSRARSDLENGRPDIARDRLQGYLHSLHLRGEYSPDTYALLGEVFFKMNDFARAGAAWLLTDRADEAAQIAFEAFTARYGKDPVNILQAVKPRAPSEVYPPVVQERLKSWNYRYIPRRSRAQKRADAVGESDEPQSGLRPIEAGCVIAFVIGFVIVCMYLYFTIFGRGH